LWTFRCGLKNKGVGKGTSRSALGRGLCGFTLGIQTMR
jgi:hypothetical protein